MTRQRHLGRIAILGNGSLERIVPSELRPGEVSGVETLALHVARYDFAARFVQPGRLLDIACGSGYGTALLADAHPAVHCIGVDINEPAIEHATQAYARPNVRYVVMDAMHFGNEQDVGDRFDTIVSLETIEHLPNPVEFVARLATLLRPGGRIIASVPVTPSVDANPHHLTDFTESSIRKLFRAHLLVEIAHFRQVQPYDPLAILMRRELRSEDIRRCLIGYYLTHPTAILKRAVSTVRHGFANHYLTVAWERRG
jgi:SAM-dependent methyltransferase